PVMLHRVIFGSVERFIGILIEHFGGAFPTWLAPVQVNIIPVKNEYHLAYCKEIYTLLQENGFRVEMDDREEKLGYRMRESQIKKAPFTLVIGDNERDEKAISFRRHGSQKTTTMTQEEFLAYVLKEIADKTYYANENE
ncbi:MAG: threonine--tRNA ligase, partial [Erysipelotrichia bacterium]|nr:threonine--tRNA ligase [Erysipelotrichia bacterium]